MPSRCVVVECSNQPVSKNGIKLHIIPYFENDRPIAKKKAMQWIDFVLLRRAKLSGRHQLRLHGVDFEILCVASGFFPFLGYILANNRHGKANRLLQKQFHSRAKAYQLVFFSDIITQQSQTGNLG